MEQGETPVPNPPSFGVDDWTGLIEQIHAASRPAVIALTGGGASALADLLAVPGGSKSLLEAIVPYSPAALTEWLGRQPEQFCSEATALAMSVVACQRAEHLARADNRESEQPIGVACTASLVSRVPKHGPHRCHVASHTATRTASYSLELDKGARARRAEESLTGRLLLSALAQACGVTEVPLLEMRSGEVVVEDVAVADPLLVDVAYARRGVVWSVPKLGLVASPAEVPKGLLCGAFAPLHEGHRMLQGVAEPRLGGLVGYEMSVHNVDKPPLDYLTIERRRSQFSDRPLALTNAPTFAAKARILPGTTFVVGIDTAERIVQPRYYGDRPKAMHAALDEIRRQGCRFLVAGRLIGDRFTTLEEIPLPAGYADLFEPIPASEFRVDLSSTALRAKSIDD